MTNRPNRGWRIRENTARAVIHRSQQPLEITMTLETQPDDKQALTIRTSPPHRRHNARNYSISTVPHL